MRQAQERPACVPPTRKPNQNTHTANTKKTITSSWGLGGSVQRGSGFALGWGLGGVVAGAASRGAGVPATAAAGLSARLARLRDAHTPGAPAPGAAPPRCENHVCAFAPRFGDDACFAVRSPFGALFGGVLGPVLDG